MTACDPAALRAALAVQRAQTIALLGTRLDRWPEPLQAGGTVAAYATWLGEVDRRAARGRVLALATPVPASAPVAAPIDLLEGAAAATRRLTGRLRWLPPPLWRARWGLRDGRAVSLADLLGQRLLTEWVVLTDPLLGGSGLVPPPQVAVCLVDAALARWPHAVLARSRARVGVVQFAVAAERRGPVVRRWGVDFPRRHYGPRVTASPDATITTWSGALARLLERRVGPGGLDAEDLRIDGDAALAAAALPGPEGG